MYPEPWMHFLVVAPVPRAWQQHGREGVSAEQSSGCWAASVGAVQAVGWQCSSRSLWEEGESIPEHRRALPAALMAGCGGTASLRGASILSPPFLSERALSFPSPHPLPYNCFLGLCFMLR